MQILPGITLVRRPVCANARYRDAAGFCLLTNRCWSGRSCPTTELGADRARAELVRETSRKVLGFGTVELVVGVVVLGLLVAGGFGVKAMVDGARKEGHEAGRKEALLEVAQRDNKKLTDALARVRELEGEKAAIEQQHRDRVANIDKQREQEVGRVRTDKDRIIAELHDRARLRDAGQANGGSACRGGDRGAGAPGAAGERDAAARGDPPATLVDDEVDEDVYTAELLAEGDEAIVDLKACQAIVIEDRRRTGAH